MSHSLPFRFSFSKLLHNKRFTVIFSILFAFVFWLIITIIQNPIRTKTFTNLTVTVPISDNAFLTEEKLNIVSDFSQNSFSVEVSGPNYLVSSLSSEDFILVASLDSVTAAGTYSLKVNGVSNSSKSGYTFVSVTPSTIDVTFDYIDTKEFSVKPAVSKVNVQEGYVADTPVLTKTEHGRVEITGPRSIINQIKTVGAVAQGNENKKLDKTAVYPAAIVLYDEAGNVIYTYANDGTVYDASGNAVKNNQLTLSVKLSDVTITQPVYKETQVSITPTFINLPKGATADLVVYEIKSGDKITVFSSDPPNEIFLTPIDWNKVSRIKNKFECEVSLPDGVKTTTKIEPITVVINYEESRKNFTANK